MINVPSANEKVTSETMNRSWYQWLAALARSVDTSLAGVAAQVAALAAHAGLTTTAHGSIVASSDARLSDSRTPTAHASTHVTGGSDAVANVVAGGNSGLMSGADKTKLDGIAEKALAYGYALNGGAASQATTTDGQTMYWGSMPGVAPGTTADRCRLYVPKAGKIKVVYVFSYSGTAGSNETWTMYVRLNNSTDTKIADLGSSANNRVWSNKDLSIDVAQGDYLEIKEVQPTWVTNPATVTRAVVVYIE